MFKILLSHMGRSYCSIVFREDHCDSSINALYWQNFLKSHHIILQLENFVQRNMLSFLQLLQLPRQGAQTTIILSLSIFTSLELLSLSDASYLESGLLNLSSQTHLLFRLIANLSNLALTYFHLSHF